MSHRSLDYTQLDELDDHVNSQLSPEEKAERLFMIHQHARVDQAYKKLTGVENVKNLARELFRIKQDSKKRYKEGFCV